ncbi:MAG: class I SAM-dependent methyltransferase [Planctomycetes bacterium]|nr:class I SAM-dependent methyltransferase [Planctomycetota bacterium]
MAEKDLGILTNSAVSVGSTRLASDGMRADPDRARLSRRQEAWDRRPLLREIYHRYHQMISTARSTVAGKDVELGAGHGSFAQSVPGVLSCDIIPCPWLDCAADAARLPFRAGCLANLIMVDVLHHIARPADFFAEAARTLAPGGRVLLVEPYTSPASWIAWRFFHEERIDLAAQPLEDGGLEVGLPGSDPWDANIAVPTILFWRQLRAFHARFPNLSVIRRNRFDLLLYPLSGGFERRPLVPSPLVPLLRAGERALRPLSGLLAFRCFIVVEKAPS